MVLGNGGGSEKQWVCSHLCGFKAVEPECDEGNTPIPRVDEILAQMAGVIYFTKLDANSGFWQIPLSSESRLLTTFLTPYGRYCFYSLLASQARPSCFKKE